MLLEGLSVFSPREKALSFVWYLIVLVSNNEELLGFVSVCDSLLLSDMEEDMDLTEDDFRNVSGQFSRDTSTATTVRDTVNVSAETVKVDVSCILFFCSLYDSRTY